MAHREGVSGTSLSKEDALEYALDTGERLRLVSLVGGYRHDQIQGRHLMLELGNPSVMLLLGYLLVLPGIILEFFLMKRLWYFGFDLYGLYVFLLATGCVVGGFYLVFRKSEAEKTSTDTADSQWLIAAATIATISLLIVVLLGRESPGIAILFSITLIVAAVIAFATAKNIERKDIFPISLYGAGIIAMAMSPVHQAFGLLGDATGTFQLTILDWGLIVLGVSFALVAINSIKTRMGFFACWLLGAMIIALVAFHEVVAIQSSSNFEIYDQVLALEGTIFSIVPLFLYFAKERESAKLWSYVVNAKRSLDRKSYARALKEAEKAIELLSASGLSRKYSLPWSVAGDVYFRVGKFNRARTLYDMALSIDPKDVETLSNLGSMLAFKGYGEHAINAYQKAIALQPHDARLWNNLGVVFLSLRKYDHALASFRKAIEYDDSFEAAHYNAGMVLIRSGKPSAAMKHFQKLIRLAPDDANVKRALERARFIHKCFQQAAGWRMLGLEVTELIQTILQSPRKFEDKYKEYLDTIIRNLSITVFEGDREQATLALQRIQDQIKTAGKNLQNLRIDIGLNLDQLRFCLAVLLLSRNAEFRTVRKNIWVVPVRSSKGSSGRGRVASSRKDIGPMGSPSIS